MIWNNIILGTVATIVMVTFFIGAFREMEESMNELKKHKNITNEQHNQRHPTKNTKLL